MDKREAVVVTRAVFPRYWPGKFDDALAAARSGAEGVTLSEQSAGPSGRFPINTDALLGKTGTAVLIRQDGTGQSVLYQQGWTDEKFVPAYAPYGGAK